MLIFYIVSVIGWLGDLGRLYVFVLVNGYYRCEGNIFVINLVFEDCIVL